MDLDRALFGRNKDAVKCFEESMAETLNPDEAGGKKARSFARGFPSAEPDRLADARLGRAQVLGLARDPSINTATACAAALAWGGMRIDHRNMLAKDPGWLRVAQDIRDGKLDRRAAYDAFQKLSDGNRLKGMGPAFFTKLIYFLAPRPAEAAPNAYIMDQWAGCSINVLSGRDVVLMDVTVNWVKAGERTERKSNYRVSRHNTAEHYEYFCLHMDALADKFEKSVDEIDRAVMGRGGSKPSAWRQHVIDHRVAYFD